MGSLTSHNGNLGRSCAHIFQKRTWGALLGACALNRANTLFPFEKLVEMNDLLFELNQGIRKYGQRSDTKKKQ